jgi:hypothetical protein
MAPEPASPPSAIPDKQAAYLDDQEAFIDHFMRLLRNNQPGSQLEAARFLLNHDLQLQKESVTNARHTGIWQPDDPVPQERSPVQRAGARPRRSGSNHSEPDGASLDTLTESNHTGSQSTPQQEVS